MTFFVTTKVGRRGDDIGSCKLYTLNLKTNENAQYSSLIDVFLTRHIIYN